MRIRNYILSDFENLMAVIEREGPEWEEYWSKDARMNYGELLVSSITFVVEEGESLCGYCRCIDDGGFAVFVMDLLVDKQFRGRSIGKALLNHVSREFESRDVYVLSDVDEYYVKLGLEKEGSIFKVSSA